MLMNSTISYEQYVIDKRREFVLNRNIIRKMILFVKILIWISSLGVLFLLFIGKMIQLQPTFIDGLLRKPKHNKQYQVNFDQEYMILKTSSNAFEAAKAYAMTILFCVLFLRYHVHLISLFSWRWIFRKDRRNFFYSEKVNLIDKGKIQYGTFEPKKNDTEIILPLMYDKNKRG